jgi:hypothetical protein
MPDLLSREFVSLVVGLAVLGIAAYLKLVGAIADETFFALVTVALGILGVGRYGSKDPERVMMRMLRAGRAFRPIVHFDHSNKKLVVYTWKGMRNRGLENLAKRLAKLVGYELEFRAHEVRLL